MICLFSILKRTFVLNFLFILINTGYSQVNYTIPLGDGTAGNPYEIVTLDNLAWVMLSDTAWNKHFIQTANIDALQTNQWYDGEGFSPIGSSTTKFTGSYNGKGYTISNLTINRPNQDHIGLFGYIETPAKIDSLGLTSANVNGKRYVGVIVGIAVSGSITNSYTSGSCASNTSPEWWSRTGGFVGDNRAEIQASYSNVSVNSNKGMTGGFAGVNLGTISNSYSSGDVTGTGSGRIGGFVGNNDTEISYCYSNASVDCDDRATGGFCGYNTGNIQTSFWDKETSAQNSSFGGSGLTSEEMKSKEDYYSAGWDFMDETYNGINDYWGINSTDNNSYPFLIWQGFTNDSYTCQAPFGSVSNIVIENIQNTSATVSSFDESGYGTKGYAIYINDQDNWTVPEDGTVPTPNTQWQNNGQQCIYFGLLNTSNVTITDLSTNSEYFIKIYPYSNCSDIETYEQTGTETSFYSQVSYTVPSGDGSEGTPYIIETLENLVWLMYSDTAWNKHYIQTAGINASETYEWYDSTGFIPIGNATIQFTGVYDGGGYAIDSLFINKPDEDEIGLFGLIKGSSTEIKNVITTHVDLTGHIKIGGIVGKSEDATISRCSSSGEITGNGYNGGIVGNQFGGIIKECFSTANITGDEGRTGGIAGANADGSTMINCYSTGNATNIGHTAGGLVGLNRNSTIENCYSIGTVNGGQYSGGLVGYDEDGEVINSYYDKEASGETTSQGGEGLTTAEMKDISTYLIAEWDFMDETYNGTNNYWGLNALENNAYPFLQWQGYSNTETLACQAPLTPSPGIILEDIQHNSIQVDSIIEAGYITVGYAVYINSESTWAVPNDGEEPTANTVWQDAGQQCVYFGSSNKPEIVVTGLTGNTEYFFKAFAYNDCSGTEFYEQTGADTSTITNLEFAIPNGNGTEESPYIIANLENLTWLMLSDTSWNKYYIQTANIDATSTSAWNKGAGFKPIGNATKMFTGNYNGKGYVISNLKINRPSEDRIGLFGYIDGTSCRIDSIGLTDVNIIGRKYVGGMIGIMNNATVTNSYTTGTVLSNTSPEWWSRAGGLIGDNRGEIHFCYSSVDISSNKGLMGNLVGVNMGSISNCYTNGSVTGNEGRTGGIAGENDSQITNCYSYSIVSGTNYAGGIVGYSTGTSTNCFWDKEASGQTFNDGAGTGLTTAEMKDISTYLIAEWDFMDETYNGINDYWGINSTDNNSYPFLKWQGFTNGPYTCQAPFGSVSNIVIENIQNTSATISSFDESGYGTEGYAIYINNQDNWTVPEDGTEPTPNTQWQNNGQQCIYFEFSNTPNLTVTSLSPDSKYFVKIFSYSICSGNETYEQTGTDISFYSKVNYTIPPGDGTAGNPYEIATLDDLAWVMLSDTAWNKHFIQTANIDALQTNQWYNGEGFSPIGSSTTKFTGSYNGKGYTISNLTINRPDEDRIGLFGSIETPAKIDSLGLTSANVTGKRYVGVMVGVAVSGSITNSYTSGSCTSNTSPDWWSRTGGFVGDNRGEIQASYSNVSVNSNKGMTGGFAGVNLGTISNSYSSGDVTGTGSGRIGGFVGENDTEISYCYSNASVDCDDSATGGFCGYNSGNIQNSFWDKETSAQNSSFGGSGLTTAEMNDNSTYLIAEWDFMDETYNGNNDYWGINSTDNNSYPFLIWQGFTNGPFTCQAPFGSVSNIVIENIQNTSATVSSFDESGYGTEGYAIYINDQDNWTVPEDGTEPTPNTQWQNNGQQCIYFGSLNNPNTEISNLTNCNHYYIKIYSYNECSSIKVYENTGGIAHIEPRDDIAPIPDITSLPDIIEQCSVNITDNPTAIDNCAGSVTASTMDPLTYTEEGSYVITWVYDDENGNTSSQQQNVLINDDTNPTITCMENQNREITSTESYYTVVGTEFDPIDTDDNCAISSLSNNINNLTTLEGFEFSVGTTTVTWLIEDQSGNTVDCSFDVSVSQTTSIKELLEAGVKIYPNPVKELLNISTDGKIITRVSILDIIGKIVLDETKLPNYGKINMSGLNSGIYLINIYTEKEVYTAKIIKE